MVIGERINPTGKSKFKEALRTHNMEYILREGVIQQEHGAQVLDVNVGLPEIDEPAMMEEAVRELQSIIDLPLQIDTADGRALERALRVYNGKPLVNSVNGKKESMETVFPLVKKYGGTVVALTLDESGNSCHSRRTPGGGRKDLPESGRIRHSEEGHYHRSSLHDHQL